MGIALPGGSDDSDDAFPVNLVINSAKGGPKRKKIKKTNEESASAGKKQADCGNHTQEGLWQQRFRCTPGKPRLKLPLATEQFNPEAPGNHVHVGTISIELRAEYLPSSTSATATSDVFEARYFVAGDGWLAVCGDAEQVNSTLCAGTYVDKKLGRMLVATG